MTWLQLVIYGLACFRLATLLSEDDGPYRFLKRFRSLLKREAKEHPKLRKSALHEGVDCLRCSSVWVAAPVAIFATYRDDWPAWLARAGEMYLLWMALSALAILWHRAFPKR